MSIAVDAATFPKGTRGSTPGNLPVAAISTAVANLTGLTDQIHNGKHPRNAGHMETTPKPSGVTPENIAAVLNRPLTDDWWYMEGHTATDSQPAAYFAYTPSRGQLSM